MWSKCVMDVLGFHKVCQNRNMNTHLDDLLKMPSVVLTVKTSHQSQSLDKTPFCCLKRCWRRIKHFRKPVGSGEILKFPQTVSVVFASLVFLNSTFSPGSYARNIHVWKKGNPKTARYCTVQAIPFVTVKSGSKKITQYCGGRGAFLSYLIVSYLI